jgi:predicted permease
MWGHHLRVAIRSAFKAPAFSATIVAVLGIAIAAATATFSVAYHVLLAPLPVKAEEQLVLFQKKLQLANTLVPFPYTDLVALRERCRTCESASGVEYDGAFPAVMQDGDATRSVIATFVAGDFLEVLGARMVAGRSLTAADALAGAEPVIIISEPLWRRQWGRDPDVIGRRVSLRGTPAIVAGVVAAGFEFPARAEVWQPLTLTPEQMATRDFRAFSVVVRLKPEASLHAFTQEAASYLRERQTQYGPRETKAERVEIQPLRSAIVGDARAALFVIATTVGLLLFAAMADVVGLVLIRNIGRQREYGVRGALGATRWHLVRQHVAEVAWLIAAATVLASMGAAAGVSVLVRLAPETLPRLGQIVVDWRAFVFGVSVSIICTLVAGLAPALWMTRANQASGMLLGTRSPSDRQGRAARQAIVVLQMGLVTTMLFAAIVVAAGLGQTRRAGVGFDTRGLSVVYIPRTDPHDQTPASVYLPLAQTAHQPDYLLVRTAGARASLATIRSAASELTADAVAVSAVPLDDLFSRELTLSRFEALILGCFATISLILVLTAVYGALAASVRYRSAELAIRAAMGATPRDLYGLVAKQGLALTSLGVAMAVLVIRIGGSSLARLQPSFPDVAAGAGLATLFVIAVVGAIATMIPAQRAARTNITDTLRND